MSCKFWIGDNDFNCEALLKLGKKEKIKDKDFLYTHCQGSEYEYCSILELYRRKFSDRDRK